MFDHTRDSEIPYLPTFVADEEVFLLKESSFTGFNQSDILHYLQDLCITPLTPFAIFYPEPSTSSSGQYKLNFTPRRYAPKNLRIIYLKRSCPNMIQAGDDHRK